MSEERLKYIEKIGEVVQRIVNPPQHSEQAQKWLEGIQIVKELNALARDVAAQDIALRGIASAIEELNEKVKTLTVAVVLSFLFTTIVALLVFLFK